MYRPYTVRPCSLVRERGTKIIVITCDKPFYSNNNDSGNNNNHHKCILAFTLGQTFYIDELIKFNLELYEVHIHMPNVQMWKLRA